MPVQTRYLFVGLPRFELGTFGPPDRRANWDASSLISLLLGRWEDQNEREELAPTARSISISSDPGAPTRDSPTGIVVHDGTVTEGAPARLAIDVSRSNRCTATVSVSGRFLRGALVGAAGINTTHVPSSVSSSRRLITSLLTPSAALQSVSVTLDANSKRAATSSPRTDGPCLR